MLRLKCSERTFFRILKEEEVESLASGKGRKSYYKVADIDRIAGGRNIPEEEPIKKNIQPETPPPAPPSSTGQILNKYGRAAYLYAKNIILERGGENEVAINEHHLWTYAINYQQYLLYTIESQKIRGVDLSPAGTFAVSPFAKLEDMAYKRMNDAAKVLGIGSLNAQKLKAAKEEEDDPFAKFLE